MDFHISFRFLQLQSLVCRLFICFKGFFLIVQLGMSISVQAPADGFVCKPSF